MPFSNTAEHLLAAGEGALPLRELDAAFAGIFGELVDEVERRCVAGDGEVGADPER